MDRSANAPLTVPRGEMEPGTHARRVIFIDLARAIAVVMMVFGHTSSALLARQYQSGDWYDAWQFQRGLTSSLFMLLSGFAFSIATARHWASHMQLSRALAKRVRRFSLFLVLGYALHLPVDNIWSFAGIRAERWSTFLAVDVLQLIGATFLFVQGLAMALRSRHLFMVVSFVLGALMIVFTPAVWRYDWLAVMPEGLAAYIYPGHGSLFPLFPFAASVLLGAAGGQLYARWGAARLVTFANGVLLGGGGVLVAIGMLWRWTHFDPYGPGEGQFIPGEFILRTGVSMVILAGVAHASRRITRLPHLFGAVAQESLLVYFVHLCIIYGSVWNSGLMQYVGDTLSPAQTLPFVSALVIAMILMAWYWNWYKHHRPRAARWVVAVVAILMVGRLL